MRVLLDTHSFLWFVTDDNQLSSVAKELIQQADTEVLLSIASVWEMAIKASLGKLKLTRPFDEFIAFNVAENNIGLLTIEPSHVIHVATLPFHHRDPFDRLMVVQALLENLPFVSSDRTLDSYGIIRIW